MREGLVQRLKQTSETKHRGTEIWSWVRGFRPLEFGTDRWIVTMKNLFIETWYLSLNVTINMSRISCLELFKLEYTIYAIKNGS